MKRVLILSKDDFICDQNLENPCFRTLKPHLIREEASFDIVAYLRGDKLIIFKNRFGLLEQIPLNPDLAIFLSET